MVNAVETGMDISFYEPFRSRERPLKLGECRVAAAAGAEAVRRAFELPFIDGFEHHPHHLLHQLVFKGGDSQRTFLAVLFRNVHPSCWMGLVGLISETCNDTLYSLGAHLVDGLAIGARGHVAWFRIDALVGYMEHPFIEQIAVQTLVLVRGDVTMVTKSF